MPGSAALAALGHVSLCPLLLPGPVFRLDRDAFAAGFGRRPAAAVDHTLAEDPLLSLEAIADLADRFPGRVESHTADLPLVMPGGAPEVELAPRRSCAGSRTTAAGWSSGTSTRIRPTSATRPLPGRGGVLLAQRSRAGAAARGLPLPVRAQCGYPDPLRSRAQLPASDPRAQGHERLPLPLRGGGAPRT